MAAKGKRPMRALTAGDKIEAIQRVNDGESKASVARDIGVPESTLRGWCKNEDKLRYMSSRRSSPDTDKSSDGEPSDKRARSNTPPSSPTTLDLSAQQTPAPAPVQPVAPPESTVDTPVELTTRRCEVIHPPPSTRERRAPAEPGASVSMSAISPLSGLGHLPGYSHSHLGLSFNEIATNLSLLAQLNPGLGTLSAGTAAPTSRPLRSVRSPKPAHNGAINLVDKHRSKSHIADPYSERRSKSSHHQKDAVDDALWYWLKTQQAMLDLTSQTPTAHSLQLNKPTDISTGTKPVAPAAPLNSHLDYNRNTWFWQYYKQFGGAMPQPEDKLKSASQVPKEKTENILYSQLIRGKQDGVTALVQNEDTRPNELASSPSRPIDIKDQVDKTDYPKNQSKARTVLDSLLFNSNCTNEENVVSTGIREESEWEVGAAEALEHGDKFLAWLEASGDPSVTRMHVHQLRALLQNLRARRTAAAPIHAALAPHSPPSTRRK